MMNKSRHLLANQIFQQKAFDELNQNYSNFMMIWMAIQLNFRLGFVIMKTVQNQELVIYPR